MSSVEFVVPGRVLTKNKARAAAHWSLKSREIKDWREAGFYAAANQKVPRPIPDPVTVTAYQVHAKGPVADVGACAPTVEAIIDGLTDLGCWPDDTQDHVAEKRYVANRVGDADGVVIRLEW